MLQNASQQLKKCVHQEKMYLHRILQ
jgi:hypothetical protein